MLDFVEGLVAVLDHPFAMLRIAAQSRLPWLEPSIILAFACVSSVRIFAYVPQILKAARDKNGAAAISNTTWGLFLASNLTSVLYAIFVLSDAMMAVVFLGNGLACAVILAITAHKRRHHRRHMACNGEAWAFVSTESPGPMHLGLPVVDGAFLPGAPAAQGAAANSRLMRSASLP